MLGNYRGETMSDAVLMLGLSILVVFGIGMSIWDQIIIKKLSKRIKELEEEQEHHQSSE